jgi:hypothetical protein
MRYYDEAQVGNLQDSRRQHHPLGALIYYSACIARNFFFNNTKLLFIFKSNMRFQKIPIL